MAVECRLRDSRGATDAPKFKDFILPLIFYKRLSNVFDDEFAEQVAEFGDEESAREIIEADHEDALKSERRLDCTLLYPARVQLEATPQPPRRRQLGRVRHRSHARGCPHEPAVARCP